MEEGRFLVLMWWWFGKNVVVIWWQLVNKMVVERGGREKKEERNAGHEKQKGLWVSKNMGRQGQWGEGKSRKEWFKGK